MGKFLKKRWKGIAAVGGAFLAGLAGGEAVDWTQLAHALVSVLLS